MYSIFVFQEPNVIVTSEWIFFSNIKYQWKAFIKQNLMERVVYSGPDFDQAVIFYSSLKLSSFF